MTFLFRKKKSKSKNKDRDERKAAEELLESSSTSSSSKTNKNEIDAEKYYQNKTKSEIAFLKKKQESVSSYSVIISIQNFELNSWGYLTRSEIFSVHLLSNYRTKNEFARKEASPTKNESKNLMHISTVYLSITNQQKSPGQNKHQESIYFILGPWHHI